MEILSFWNFGWLFLLYFCKESWTRIMNASSVWNILWWILVAPALAHKAKNRTILMGHTFFPYISSSVGTTTRSLGKPWHPPTERSPPSHTTRQPITLLRLCFKNRPAGLANENTRCPHLLGTATICLTPWFEAVRSDPGLRPPSTTMMPQSSASCRDVIELRGPRRC